jgi:hypothetical protein
MLTCLKIFRSTVKKLWFFKSTFDRSKNALTLCPGPRLSLIPSLQLILLRATQCAHAQESSSVSGPLAICSWPMGYYKILCGWLLSEKEGGHVITKILNYVVIMHFCIYA